MSAAAALLATLIDDAALGAPGNAGAAEAVAGHRSHHKAWFADLVGPLVVADHRLAEVGRARPLDRAALAVSVQNTTGAGGLVSLAGREVPGVQVVAVECALRDLDDLVGNAARVASAAGALSDDVRVFVEIPDAPGWERAVEVVEAAGLLGGLRVGDASAGDTPSTSQLARQLSVLVEADLPFKATAGLQQALATSGGDRDHPRQYGLLNLLAAVQALVEGASVEDAADQLSQTDPQAVATVVGGWDDAQAARVRRRFLSASCINVSGTVADLVRLGLVGSPRGGAPAPALWA